MLSPLFRAFPRRMRVAAHGLVLATFATAIGTSALTAQSAEPRLVGWNNGFVLGDCGIPQQVLCPGPSGGLWTDSLCADPRPERLWIGQTRSIQLWDTATCRELFRVPAAGSLGGDGMVVAVEQDRIRGQLFELESFRSPFPTVGRPMRTILHTWQLDSSGVPQRIATAELQGPSSLMAPVAMSFDPARELIYVHFKIPGTGLGTILTTYERDGTALCSIPVEQGGFAVPLLTTFDPATDQLIGSDFNTIVRVQIERPNGERCPVGLSLASTCPATFTNPTLLPAAAESIGSGCGTGGCGTCNGVPTLLAMGAPVLGNDEFGFRFATAGRAGDAAAIVLGAGACDPNGTAFGCGAIHLPLAQPSVTLATTTLPGGSTGQCAAPWSVDLPLPPTTALVGRSLCAQGAVLCSAGGGPGLSNALQLLLQY